MIRGYADPLVVNGDFYISAGVNTQFTSCLHHQILSQNSHHPAVGHGLNGIDDEIMEYLANLPGIYFHCPEVIRQAGLVIDLRTSAGEGGRFGGEFFN